MSDDQRLAPGLTGRELALLFNERIRPTLTGTSREDPVAVWVGGPPGAGKTTVQSAVLARLGRQDAYPLDGDDLVAQHPQYLELQRANDLQSAYLASEDLGGKWWVRAARLLRAGRIDVAVSAPLAGPDWARAQFSRFQQSGYRNEAVFVATPEAQSLQGMVDRYHRARRPEQDSYGRWVLPEWHDMAHQGVLDTVDMIDQQRAVDAIHIGRRDGSILHSNELDENGQWRLQVATRQVVVAERNRQWTPEESADFLRKQGRLRQEATAEWLPLLNEIDRRAVPVISPVAVLDRGQLGEQLGELALAREQAALRAEVAQVKAGILADRHRNGDNDRLLEELGRSGLSSAEMEQARAVMNHDRWGAGLAVGHLNRQTDQLTRLNEQATNEARRRDAQPSELHGLEDLGRRGHQAQRHEDIPGLVPRPAPAVVVRRESPRDPGPTKTAQAPQPHAENLSAEADTRPTAQRRERENKVTGPVVPGRPPSIAEAGRRRSVTGGKPPGTTPRVQPGSSSGQHSSGPERGRGRSR